MLKIPYLAIALFVSSTILSPSSAVSQTALDLCSHAETAPDVKIDACTALIKSGRYSGSGLAAAYGSRAAAYRRKKDYDRALADFNEMIRIDPEGDSGFLGRCIVYGDRGEYDRAVADCSRAIQLRSNDYLAFEIRGNTYADKKEYESAIADYTRVIHLNPKFGEAYGNRCLLRARLGRDLPQALSDCNEALRLQPDDEDVFQGRGLVELRSGVFDRAIADFTAAFAKNAEDASSLYGRGLAKLKSGDTPGGHADMAAAVAIRADIAEVYAGYGVSEASLPDQTKTLPDQINTLPDQTKTLSDQTKTLPDQTTVSPLTEPSRHGSSGQALHSGKTVTPQSPCNRLPGRWEWFMNGDVTILANGTAVQRASGLTANWSCSDRTAIFHWSHGFTDRLTLSADGNHLTGSNGVVAVWGNRR